MAIISIIAYTTKDGWKCLLSSSPVFPFPEAIFFNMPHHQCLLTRGNLKISSYDIKSIHVVS